MLLTKLSVAVGLAGVALAANAVTYTPGTYTEKVNGHNAAFTVKVTVSKNKIEKIEYPDNLETIGVGKVALDKLSKKIIDRQSLGVDNVTGATITSFALKGAVKKALEQAKVSKADMAKLMKNSEKYTALPAEIKTNVVVVGGGAAGMMAAGMAAQAGAQVTLLEQNGRLGKKLLITGKGRCNVTNDCPWQDVLQNVPTNPRFLYSALAGFSPADAKKFFEDYGCALKTERGNRVFPVSDRSQSVLDALERFLRAYHVRILPRKAAEIAVSDGRVTGVKTAEGPVPADCVILATGGLSYPATGSTGSGYAMAQAIGHTIIEPTGSLVPLVEKGHDCAKMQGLALKNIAVKLVNAKGKTVYEDFGELLFTHFGLSGPVILSASAHMARGEAGYTVRIDLKPALDEKTLDARILRDFSAAQNRDFENSLSALLPRSMIPVVIARSGIDPMQKVNSITKQQRRALLETIKCFSVPIACKAPVEDAIVTSGGVKVSEVNAKTMESKLVQGLYFAGELLDVDAYTGGFNLQIAWATGRLAGLSAAAKEFQKPEDAT